MREKSSNKEKKECQEIIGCKVRDNRVQRRGKRQIDKGKWRRKCQVVKLKDKVQRGEGKDRVPSIKGRGQSAKR